MQRLPLLALATAAVLLASCSRSNDTGNQSPANAGNAASSAPAANAAPVSPADRLLAAAEPFEALTETAFTDSPAKLDATIALGRKAVGEVRSLLAPSTAATIDSKLAEVDRFRADGNRADLALSSIEIYRSLVSSVSGSPKVPVDVSLLDYAGFRFQADMRATPVRWDDMKQAASFARSRWSALSPKVSDKAVSAPFEAALANMDKAVANRDPKLAAESVAAELDQVDKLEAYFKAL